ncbi:transposase [Paracoccus bogoriensis]|nr:transposase [Paracoccus bogoriensis]
MSAPDDAPDPAPENPSCAWGGFTCCVNTLEDSLSETSTVAGLHAQTELPTCRTINWHDDNAALSRRGSLAIRFDPETQWLAAPTGKRGRQPDFTDAAIRTCLTLKARVGLRHATGAWTLALWDLTHSPACDDRRIDPLVASQWALTDADHERLPSPGSPNGRKRPACGGPVFGLPKICALRLIGRQSGRLRPRPRPLRPCAGAESAT